jgi:hypothetical protein
MSEAPFPWTGRSRFIGFIFCTGGVPMKYESGMQTSKNTVQIFGARFSHHPV